MVGLKALSAAIRAGSFSLIGIARGCACTWVIEVAVDVGIIDGPGVKGVITAASGSIPRVSERPLWGTEYRRTWPARRLLRRRWNNRNAMAASARRRARTIPTVAPVDSPCLGEVLVWVWVWPLDPLGTEVDEGWVEVLLERLMS